MLRLPVVLIAACCLVFSLVGLADSASASPGAKCTKIDRKTQRCVAYADTPADPNPVRTSTKLDVPKSRATKCQIGDAVIPCRTANGVWSDRFQCYVKRMSNQPPKSDPAWEGHKSGALYWCTAPDDQDSMVVWLPSTPSLPPPDPRSAGLACDRIHGSAGDQDRDCAGGQAGPGRAGRVADVVVGGGSGSVDVGSDHAVGVGARLQRLGDGAGGAGRVGDG